MNRFEAAISKVQCWDKAAHDQYLQYGVPPDCILQNRRELLDLCLWMEAHQIRSYLEIGIWTGRLTTFLDSLFQFDKLAVCDDGGGARMLGNIPIQLPSKTKCFWGSSHSIEYMAWRQSLGHIDFVLIDGDHSYEGVKQDFLINKRYPHRYMALHDIVGAKPATAGVKRLWQELEGQKTELINHQAPSNMGIGIWQA